MWVRVLSKAILRCAVLIAAAVPAVASDDILSDADLLSRASAVMAVKTALADRVLGIHHGVRVYVDLWCGDVCPAYTVRIIHYETEAGPACTAMGGDNAAILVPMAIAMRTQNFCIPHVLYRRNLYTDRPYQK